MRLTLKPTSLSARRTAPAAEKVAIDVPGRDNAATPVNTDADQVIVATAGEHGPGQLPEIRYESGGLESEYVRRKVCEILEGGEEAFRARARRLRVRFE